VKLTLTSEYALLALLYLARHKSEGFINVQKIAKAQGIPPRFLEQILRILKLSNYVQSLKGKKGGFRLARPSEKITLAEIVRLFDGALAPTKSASKYFHEATPVEKEKKLLRLFQEIRDFIADKMENTTLANV
jgi:Rrf2 family transcriptional regulator, cysteine metabolism repressor